jgi:hypothetical protein
VSIANRSFYVAFALLVSASVALRYLAFLQTDFATGWDSYFYLVQLKSLVTTGRMHSPEGSLVYPYFQGWLLFVGDYVTALKVGTAFLCGCWTALCCLFPSDKRMGLLLGAWSVFSPQLTYFAAQYPKNMLGLVLFGALIWATMLSGRRRFWWVVLLLMANYFGHRLMFSLSVLYLCLHVVMVWQQHTVRWQVSRKQVAAACGVLITLAMAAAWIPGLAHLIDFQRLNGSFSNTPQWAFWSFATTFDSAGISVHWWIELALMITLLVWAGVDAWRGRPWVKPVLAFWGLCLLLQFPFLQWQYTGLSWRFFLVLMPLTPWLLKEKLPFRYHTYWVALCLTGSIFSWKSYEPSRHDPDYRLFDRITTRAAAQLTQQPAELVIAHNALAEYFTFTTGIDAMPWLPEYAIDSSKLWRLAAGVRLETLRYYAADTLQQTVLPVAPGYFLLREQHWQQALSAARQAEDSLFLRQAMDWKNPHTQRPGWLLHRKK